MAKLRPEAFFKKGSLYRVTEGHQIVVFKSIDNKLSSRASSRTLNHEVTWMPISNFRIIDDVQLGRRTNQICAMKILIGTDVWYIVASALTIKLNNWTKFNGWPSSYEFLTIRDVESRCTKII